MLCALFHSRYLHSISNQNVRPLKDRHIIKVYLYPRTTYCRHSSSRGSQRFVQNNNAPWWAAQGSAKQGGEIFLRAFEEVSLYPVVYPGVLRFFWGWSGAAFVPRVHHQDVLLPIVRTTVNVDRFHSCPRENLRVISGGRSTDSRSRRNQRTENSTSVDANMRVRASTETVLFSLPAYDVLLAC